MRGLQRSPAPVKLPPRLVRSHSVAGSLINKHTISSNTSQCLPSGRVSVWLRGCSGSLRSCQQHSTLVSHEQHTRASHIDSLHHRIAMHKESDMPPRASQNAAGVQHAAARGQAAVPRHRRCEIARLHVRDLLTPGKHETAAYRSTLPTTMLCGDRWLVAPVCQASLQLACAYSLAVTCH